MSNQSDVLIDPGVMPTTSISNNGGLIIITCAL